MIQPMLSFSYILSFNFDYQDMIYSMYSSAEDALYHPVVIKDQRFLKRMYGYPKISCMFY
jgi:hypothetical protein